jgi:PAS domain S-box-containing protein
MNGAPSGHTARLKISKGHFSPGIRTRLIFAILLVTLTVSLIGLSLNTQRDITRMRQATVEALLLRLAAMRVDFVNVLTDREPEYVVELVDELNIYEDIHHIVLRDNNGRVVFRYNFHEYEPHELPDFIQPDNSSAIIYGDDNILMHHTVMYGGKRYGWVSIWVDAVDIKQQYRAYALTAVLLMIGAFFITLVLAVLAGHYFSRPIRKLADFVGSASRDHDFSRRLAAGQKGEIGELYDGVNVMLDEIAAAEGEICRLNESRIHNIVESAMDGVISISRTGGITYWSKQAENIFGWSEKEVLGHPLADTIIPERYRQQHNEGLKRLEFNEKSTLNRRISVEGLHRDGHEVPVEISLSAIKQHGDWILNAFIRDLSEQRRAEQEMRDMQKRLLRKERLATVGQLTATVAHELRNPMGTIQNTLYLLTRKLAGEAPDTVGLLERISRNIKRCDLIISELLDFTRDREIRPVPTVIDSWLARLLDGYDCPDGVELVRKLTTGVRVPVDIAYFESAVINVLNNAVQAAVDKHPGGGRVEVDTVFENGRIGVVISDNGSGIAAEDSEHVFDPLYSTKVYGVGLGLPTVKKVMEKHAGEVSLESGPEGGARVILWLKIDEPS